MVVHIRFLEASPLKQNSKLRIYCSILNYHENIYHYMPLLQNPDIIPANGLDVIT